MHFRKWSPGACITFIISGAVLLSSCAQQAFREDFRGFNSAYADMLNEQMLLNIARLDNGHPAEFLAIGSIDSRFTFNSSAAGGFNSSNTNSTVGSGTSAPTKGIFALTGKALSKTLSLVTGDTASLSAGVTSQPEFQWIPLNNETVSKEVLQPMDTEVFYSLYQQGFPVDQLLRVMVERIETTLPGEGDLVLVNSPTRGKLESYGRFLRACEMLRELQRAGALVLETSKEYEPVALFTRSPQQGGGKSGGGSQGGGQRANPADDNGAGDSPKGGSGGQGNFKKIANEEPAPTNVPLEPVEDFQPTPEQVMSAEKDGYTWRRIREGVWELGKYQHIPKFYLKNGEGRNPVQIILANGIITDKHAIENLVMLLKDGFTVKSTVREHTSARTCLILRSYTRALEATSIEQEGFAELLKHRDRYQEFFGYVPFESSQCRPILQSCWDDQSVPLLRPLVKIDYAGKTYQITDPVHPIALDPNRAPLDDSATWNRDVYRLIVALNSQVTVDISKFQRQILELQQ